MPTFIKAGFWEQTCKTCKGYNGWLNLDDMVNAGTSGTSGMMGSSGTSGATFGTSGTSGLAGTSGNSGTSGINGQLGYRGSFYDTTNQTGVSGSVLTMGSGNSEPWNSGVSITSGSQITIANPGVYNLAFSAQMVKTNGNTATHAHICYHKMVQMYLLVLRS